MHLKPEEFVKVIDAFARLFDTMGIRSSGGRTMLGTEIFLGVFMLLAFAIILLHEVFAAVYSWLRGQDFIFHADRSFLIYTGVMIFSIIIVLIREMLGRASRPEA